MADRGKKKLPTGMAVVDGSGRPNAKTRGKQKRASLPEAPAHLTGHALDFYNELLPILEEMGIGAKGDKWTLESMAVVYGQARDAEDHVAEHGAMQWHKRKEAWAKNPAVVTSQQNRDKLRLWFNEVGLTPSARAKLGDQAEARGEDNPFKAFA